MGASNQELKGPDLAAGVEVAEVPEGQPLLGHVDGEPVVLVREGEKLCAIGATCSHYSGPLAEGLVVGDTIRCPWHHACFSLETGEALGGPALNPLPVYELVRDGGRVKVGGKRAVSARVLEGEAPSSVVVVGAGPAGAAAIEALRREGYRGPVRLLGDEAPGPVDRPNLSKDYLAGGAPEEWIPLRDAEFYRELEVEFSTDDAAVALDAKQHTLTLKSGARIPFGALLLATGCAPRRLSTPGAELPHVHTLRTLGDSRSIIAGAAGKKRAVVIGSSFIALEAAASLRKRGLEVTVVARDSVPLKRVFGEELGRYVRRLHEQNDVVFHFGATPERIDPERVLLSDGTELQAELVVAGVGVAPRTELAENAGLHVDDGIVVDASLQTSAPGIYAAGDVARYPDPITGELARIEHFAFAERQGRAAARFLLGRGTPFRDAPFFWSQHYDVSICSVGHAKSWDRIETRGSLDNGDYSAAYLREGRILSVVTVGRDSLSLRADAALEAGDQTALRALFEG